MTFDEAMHTTCEGCGGEAQRHRMTDAGNFYCLQSNNHNNWRTGYQRSNMTDGEVKQWAISRAKCNELKKSPLSSIKGLAEAIIQAIRTSPEPMGEQLSL